MGLSPLSEALQSALSIVRPGPVERVPVAEARGCLAERIVATRDVPGCDNSAMDGYALRAEETRDANRDQPMRFRVVETIYAGHRAERAIGPGEAARIFTGAPIPEGADTVVRQEATVARDGEVDVVIEALPGQNIRRRGEEIAEGAVLFEEAQRIDAYAAGVLASLGIHEVPVRRAPRVAILTVGDELLVPGAPAEPHQIYDSNGVFLRALVEAANGQVVVVSRASDQKDGLRKAIEESLARADVIITCGGASVGDRDLVKVVLRELGAELVVDGVALKPGKPVAVARLGEKLAIVLPGNPGAAAVAFDRLARPILWALQGAFEVRQHSRVKLDSDRRKQPALTWYLSARTEFHAGALTVRVRPQGAGQLLQNVRMDGWVVLPSGRGEFHKGEWVELELLHGSTFVPLASRPVERMRDALPAVSVIGWSDSGKTTLIEGMLRELRARGMRVAVLKHSSDEHPMHKPGSDTERFAEAGAEAVAFVTSQGAQLTVADPDPMQALQSLLSHTRADLVLVEGWKDGPLPKIVVQREGTPELDVKGEVLARVQSLEASATELVDLVLKRFEPEPNFIQPEPVEGGARLAQRPGLDKLGLKERDPKDRT